MLELQSYSKWDENANCPVTLRIYVERPPDLSCYEFRGARSSLEIVFPRTWRTGRTTTRVRHEEVERRSVRSPGSGASPWPTRRDTVNGNEACPCSSTTLASRARIQRGGWKWRRRSSSSRIFLVSSQRRRCFREADRSILCSSTTVLGPLNASGHFPCRVDDR